MLRPRTLVLLGMTIIMVALFALAGFVRPVRDAGIRLLSPVTRFVSGIGFGVSGALRMDRPTREANARSEELEARLRAQVTDYVRLRALEEENRALRAQAKFISEHAFRTIGARVISRSVGAQTAVVEIDRGKSDGADIGQAVITEDGFVVGKIIRIGSRTASVMLLSDIRSRFASAVVGGDRVTGIVEGRGNGVTHFTLVPQEVVLEKNQVIVTAGTEEQVPADLPIGLVIDVERKPTDPFQNAVVEPLAPIDRLRLVSVLIPGGN
jgi:rod shape-determining protein MreC